MEDEKWFQSSAKVVCHFDDIVLVAHIHTSYINGHPGHSASTGANPEAPVMLDTASIAVLASAKGTLQVFGY